MKTWLLVIICGTGVAMASEHPKVDAVLAECDAHLASLEAAFAARPAESDEKARIKARLGHMVEVDQYLRNFTMHDRGLSPAENVALNQQVANRMSAVDSVNTAELKNLLKTRSWITISEFGPDADRDAWLLVQHADNDPDFQRDVLQRLEPLLTTGETNHSNYAYLFDRVASSFSKPAEQRPQRYGTQGRCTGPGTWTPYPVEEPEKLEERRRAVGLFPMAEYLEMFKDICRMTEPP